LTPAPSTATPPPNPASTPDSTDSSQTTDVLALWGEELTTGGRVSLRPLRLDSNERLVIPFTTAYKRVPTHYCNSTAVREYIHCAGSGCLFCRLGRQVEIRDLLPVYDAIDRVVSVLSISPSLRPHALRPQLMPILQRLKERSRLLVGITKPEMARFVVTTYDLPPDADDGASAISSFVEQFEAGRIDLGSVISRLTAAELATIPEIASMMALKGVKLE
jgi:hypothetical protein